MFFLLHSKVSWKTSVYTVYILNYLTTYNESWLSFVSSFPLFTLQTINMVHFIDALPKTQHMLWQVILQDQWFHVELVIPAPGHISCQRKILIPSSHAHGYFSTGCCACIPWCPQGLVLPAGHLDPGAPMWKQHEAHLWTSPKNEWVVQKYIKLQATYTSLYIYS